jgi:hypothetical protein
MRERERAKDQAHGRARVRASRAPVRPRAQVPSERKRRKWWRRRELNPRPEASRERPLHAQPLLSSRPAVSRRGKTTAGHPRMDFAAASGDPQRLHPHLASALEARRVRSSNTVTT